MNCQRLFLSFNWGLSQEDYELKVLNDEDIIKYEQLRANQGDLEEKLNNSIHFITGIGFKKNDIKIESNLCIRIKFYTKFIKSKVNKVKTYKVEYEEYLCYAPEYLQKVASRYDMYILDAALA